MMRIKTLTCVMIGVLFFSARLYAAEISLLASPTLYGLWMGENQGSTDFSSTSLSYGLTLGGVFDNGLAIHGKLFGMQTSSKAKSTSDDNETDTVASSNSLQAYGAGLGWVPREYGLYAAASYLLAPEWTVKTDDDSTKYFGGSAIMVDLGWRFGNRDFGYGPQLSYLSSDFKKKTDTETYDLEHTLSEKIILPYFAIWIIR